MRRTPRQWCGSFGGMGARSMVWYGRRMVCASWALKVSLPAKGFIALRRGEWGKVVWWDSFVIYAREDSRHAGSELVCKGNDTNRSSHGLSG
jgi:hypothetical protein